MALFFFVENRSGDVVDVSANFFRVPRGARISVKKYGEKEKRGWKKPWRKKEISDVVSGDMLIYSGRDSGNGHIDKAYANAKGLEPGRKYQVKRVVKKGSAMEMVTEKTVEIANKDPETNLTILRGW